MSTATINIDASYAALMGLCLLVCAACRNQESVEEPLASKNESAAPQGTGNLSLPEWRYCAFGWADGSNTWLSDDECEDARAQLTWMMSLRDADTGSRQHHPEPGCMILFCLSRRGAASEIPDDCLIYAEVPPQSSAPLRIHARKDTSSRFVLVKEAVYDDAARKKGYPLLCKAADRRDREKNKR